MVYHAYLPFKDTKKITFKKRTIFLSMNPQNDEIRMLETVKKRYLKQVWFWLTAGQSEDYDIVQAE